MLEVDHVGGGSNLFPKFFNSKTPDKGFPCQLRISVAFQCRIYPFLSTPFSPELSGPSFLQGFCAPCCLLSECE